MVDAQQPAAGVAQVAAQPGFGLEGADQLVAAPRRLGVGAVDELLEMRDQVGSHVLVPLGGLRVVAHDEPLRAGALLAVTAAVLAGVDVHFCDPRAVRDAAGAAPHPPQVVLDGADDRGVSRVAREASAAHRDPLAGDRHRDHHLR